MNPSYPEVNGRECFPSVAAAVAAAKIPVDLALVAIPADAVLPELERCAAAGVRNALIVSSGFAEEGAERSALQARISAIARAGGMRVVGPNSEGFLNAVGRVSASFSPTVEYAWKSVDGGAARKRIAVVAQSGGMGFGMHAPRARRGSRVQHRDLDRERGRREPGRLPGLHGGRPAHRRDRALPRKRARLEHVHDGLRPRARCGQAHRRHQGGALRGGAARGRIAHREHRRLERGL